MKNIIQDTFIIDFYQRKTGKVFLVDQEQVYQHILYFEEGAFGLVHTRNYFHSKITNAISNPHLVIRDVIGKLFPTVLECLESRDGKLSICGTLEELFNSHRQETKEYTIHLYFHSCTIVETKVMLLQCLNLFGSNKKFILKNKYIFINCHTYNVVFYISICKNIEELLLYRGHVIERQLWNPKNGYVTTLDTSIAIGMSAYPINIALSATKLQSYECLGMSIIFHGLNISEGTSFYPNTNIIDVGAIILDKYKTGLQLPYYTLCFNEKGLVIEAKKLSEYPINLLDISLEDSINHLHCDDLIIGELVNICGLSNYSPITYPKFNLQQHLGKDYKVYDVGIDNNTYVALSNLAKYYCMPEELLQLICKYFLEQEVLLARDRLLNLVSSED